MTCECVTWARTDGRLTMHHPRCPSFEQSRYVRIRMESGGIYVQPANELGSLLDEIKEADVGEKWTLELVEMTREEYARLPEFAGH
jgi:hypothetical protein